MKKKLRVLLGLILSVLVLTGSTLGEATVSYAKANSVKAVTSKGSAKTIKLNTTYSVSGFKKNGECYVSFTLKEKSNFKVDVSNVNEGGTLQFRVRPADNSLILVGYRESIHTSFDEKSASIKAMGSQQALPAGKYYIIFEASADTDGELLQSCNVKVTVK